MEHMEIWQIVHRERAALIDDLGGISADAWAKPSLCDGWSIHDVVAHFVDDATTTRLSFFLALAWAGFDFDRANRRGVERKRKRSPAETLASFRDARERTTSAPAPIASRLVEAIVHSEDIRRPLGIAHTYPTEAVIEGVIYQLATSGSMGGSKERAAGVRLTATDADFGHGEGPIVRGSALDLLLALTGRDAGYDGLLGEGVQRLRRG